MPGASGVAPIVVVSTEGAKGLLAALNAGQRLRGVVVESRSGLAVHASGSRLQLPQDAPLLPGQKVEVSLAAQKGAVQVQLLPTASTEAAASTPTAPSSAAFIESILRALGALTPEKVATATQILPTGAPLTEAIVRTLLEMFASRGNLGRDLTAVGSLIQTAVAAGVLPAELVDQLTKLIERLAIKNERALDRMLQQAGRTLGKSLEGRLAALIARGEGGGVEEALAGDLRAQLVLLRGNKAFLKFLSATGKQGEFSRAVDGILERLTGVFLQNLRGLGHAYHFLELPFAPGGPILSGQVHIFGEGGGRDAETTGVPSSVVLDLDTTRLGALWIQLRRTATGCECRFRATTQEAVQAILAASSELRDGLKDTGYGPAKIEASLWDGDRFREAGELMRRFAGIDLNA